MGFFGKLFGGGGKRVPSWARDAFADVARFDAFVDVVATVLEGAASTDDISTGSVMLDNREWILHEVARTCAEVDASKWREIVERSYRSSDSSNEVDDLIGEEEPSRPWIIGTAAWGGVMFECGDSAMVLVLLPIVDRAPLASV